MRPPGRTTRASSANTGSERDEVAQREPADRTVGGGVGHREVDRVGLGERGVGAGVAQHAE